MEVHRLQTRRKEVLMWLIQVEEHQQVLLYMKPKSLKLILEEKHLNKEFKSLLQVVRRFLIQAE